MSKNLNYNKDFIKHYVRYNGWRSSFRTLKNYVEREVSLKKRSERCRYLTFCAAQAIDVFMLELERYIYRDPETNRLANVFFCENDEESFSLIQKMIGSEGQGFFGDFKSIVLQNLEEELVISDDPFDEPTSALEREKLRLKEVKRNLLKVFPFDVINLDFYGNFFPKQEQRYSESCQTYNEVLKLQKIKNGHSCNRFLMFLTVYTPVAPNQINESALNLLTTTLGQNMAYERFRDTFKRRFQTLSQDTIDVYLRFVLGFTKQIVFRESYKLGWQPIIKEIYCYDRNNSTGTNPYKISTFVVEYYRNERLDIADFTGTIPNFIEGDYLNQLENILLNQPHDVPNEEQISEDIKDHLSEVVTFRNDFLKKIDIYEEGKFN